VYKYQIQLSLATIFLAVTGLLKRIYGFPIASEFKVEVIVNCAICAIMIPAFTYINTNLGNYSLKQSKNAALVS